MERGKKGIKNRKREKRDITVETTRGGWEVTSRDRSFVKFKYYCRWCVSQGGFLMGRTSARLFSPIFTFISHLPFSLILLCSCVYSSLPFLHYLFFPFCFSFSFIWLTIFFLFSFPSFLFVVIFLFMPKYQ